MSNTIQLDVTTADIFRGSDIGSHSTAMGEALYGLHPLMLPMPIPINRDYHGLTLFTRPQMNMTMENLRSVAKYTSLLSTDPRSVGRAVRAMLDPRLHYTGVFSDLIDPNSAFIPFLSNCLESCSGFPDIEYQFYISEPGIANEVFGMVDSISDQYSARTISSTFRNSAGSILLKLFDVWTSYASNAFVWNLDPYPDAMVENWIDYQTRIWRIVLDHSKTYVQHLGCTGASVPQGVPFGRVFDYERDTGINEGLKEIQISWQSFGVMYDEPILISDFNKVVACFHGGMKDANRKDKMRLLTAGEYNSLRCRCYPRIHPDSYKLEWWVDNAVYLSYMKAYSNRSKALIIT